MPKSGAVVIPPPLLGWNTRDALSDMGPQYAVEAENFIANGGAVQLRKGSALFATPGPSTSVDYITAMATYADTSGTQRIVAVNFDTGAQTTYSVDVDGNTANIGGGASVADVTTEVIYFCNFNNRIFIKSADSSKDVYHWTGTGNIALSAFTGPGGDDKALRQMCSYKNRLYFCGIDAKVWYGGLNAVTGALTSFDFASVFPNGGNIVYCAQISPNPSNNRDSYFLAYSSTGDILMYGGDNPGNVTWNLIGTYFMGQPIGKQAFIPFQNDILIITRQGLVSTLALISGSALENSYLSDLVNTPFQEAIDLIISTGYIDNISGTYYPAGNYILINLSNGGSDSYNQFIFYTVNKSWWLFTGYAGPRFWLPFNNGLYFATSQNGRIFQADFGYSDVDFDGTTVLSKTIKLRHAFNFLGNNISTKQFTQAVPTVYQSEGLALTLDCDVDYTDVTATSTETDTTDTAYKLYQPRMGLTNQVLGSAVSIRIDGTVTTKRMSLQATKVFWIDGGTE